MSCQSDHFRVPFHTLVWDTSSRHSFGMTWPSQQFLNMVHFESRMMLCVNSTLRVTQRKRNIFRIDKVHKSAGTRHSIRPHKLHTSKYLHTHNVCCDTRRTRPHRIYVGCCLWESIVVTLHEHCTCDVCDQRPSIKAIFRTRLNSESMRGRRTSKNHQTQLIQTDMNHVLGVEHIYNAYTEHTLMFFTRRISNNPG